FGEALGEFLGDGLSTARGDVLGIDERTVLREELDELGRVLRVIRGDIGVECFSHRLLGGGRRRGGGGGRPGLALRHGSGRLDLRRYGTRPSRSLPEAGWGDRADERHSE